MKALCGHLCGLGASPPLPVTPRACEHTVNWRVGPQLPLENSSQTIIGTYISLQLTSDRKLNIVLFLSDS